MSDSVNIVRTKKTKKHKNRIEVVGAYYIEIIIGKIRFKCEKFYETKSSALRAARRISKTLSCLDRKEVFYSADNFNNLPIYDYDGIYPVGKERAKYEVIY